MRPVPCNPTYTPLKPTDMCGISRCTADVTPASYFCRWGRVASKVVPHVRADSLSQLRSGLAVYTTRIGRLQVWGGTGGVWGRQV